MIKRFSIQFYLTLIIFILINTIYFWEGEFGIGAFIPYLFLLCVVIILLIELIRQFYISFRDRFTDRNRNKLLLFMVFFLFLIIVKPQGIINFEKLKGDDLLVAQREGAANCITVLRLKTNKKFTFQSVCFGIERSFGNYEVKNDSIFFEKERNRFDYKFAIIKKDTLKSKIINQQLYLFKNKEDEKPYQIFIITNKLIKN